MKIRFLKRHKPKGQAEDIPDYKQGEVYEFRGSVAEGYAAKYVRLGLAVEHVVESVAPASQVDPVRDFRKHRGRAV